MIIDMFVSSTTPSSILSKNTDSKIYQAKAFAIDKKIRAVIENQFKSHYVKATLKMKRRQYIQLQLVLGRMLLKHCKRKIVKPKVKPITLSR